MSYHAQELKDRIIARWNQGGVTTAQLAKQFGMASKSAVCGVLHRARKAGVEVRFEYPEGTVFGRPKNHRDPVALGRVKGPSTSALHWNGWNEIDLANAAGVTREAVRQWRQLGVPAGRIPDVIRITGMRPESVIARQGRRIEKELEDIAWLRRHGAEAR